MPTEFLFGVPNDVGAARSRRLRPLALVLTACGIASLVNAIKATANEAFKSYHVQQYTNVHWITTIYLYAGLSALLLDRLKINWFLYLSLGLCIVTIPISIGSVVADSANLETLRAAGPAGPSGRWGGLNEDVVHAMRVFAGWDLAYSLVAGATAAAVLWELSFLSSRYFERVDGFRSRLLLGSGALLTLVGFLRSALWIAEYAWLKGLGKKAQFLFLHYTMDEPMWNVVYLITGLLICFVAVRGTRVLMFVTVGLTLICGYPTLLYLWIDYRWFSNVKLSEVTVAVPKPPMELLEWNLGLGAWGLLLLLLTLWAQLRLLRASGPSFAYALRLKTDPTLRRALMLAGLLFLAAGGAFLISDVANLVHKSFYRVFYPTEQRAPFLLAVTGVLTLLALRDYLALYFLPLAFVLVINVLHSTVFHIVAYLFLTYHTYYNDELCELFYFGMSSCTATIERVGSVAHFLEAALAVSLALLAIYTAVILGRLMSVHAVQMGTLSGEESARKRRWEGVLWALGVGRLLLGLIVVLISLFDTGKALAASTYKRHPLIQLHTYLYRTCLSLALLIYPVIQLVFTRNLVFHPLRSVTLLIISMVRFLDILTQLDYRNFSHGTALGWLVFSIAEIFATFLHFGFFQFFFFITNQHTLQIVVIVSAVAAILDLSINRPPRFDFIEPGGENGERGLDLDEGEVTDAEEGEGKGVPPADPEPWSHQMDPGDGYRLVAA